MSTEQSWHELALSPEHLKLLDIYQRLTKAEYGTSQLDVEIATVLKIAPGHVFRGSNTTLLNHTHSSRPTSAGP
jgi:hypothetical protein